MAFFFITNSGQITSKTFFKIMSISIKYKIGTQSRVINNKLFVKIS